MKKMKYFASLLLSAAMVLSLLAGCADTPANDGTPAATPDGPQGETRQDTGSQLPDGALVIAEQGMFSAGGTVLTSDGTFDVSNYYLSREGSTSHVDHANVFYQIPAEETGLPVVFLHGYGQSRMGWMTTPDGRPGWSDLFLRMGHSVFLIDQPRRGEAGQTSVAGTISTEPSDQTWYTQFRIGTYQNDEFTRNEGSQFPEGEDVLDQFFRQMTPDTAMDSANGDQNIDTTVVAQAVAAAIDEVYERTGKDSILVTHSQGGMPGWETARYTDHIAAIVAIEPGMAPMVDSDDYSALLEKNIPVTFYYGDYIGQEFTDVPAAGIWGMMASSADAFTAAYTAAGGTSTVVHLPDEGITGNDHFMFQDLNNDVIARHVEAWIQSHVGVSGSTAPQAPAAPENENGKTLVVYYSATGSTEAVAGYIANATGGDTFAITPTEPYSSDDLNWRDSNSRVSREHDDPSLRTMDLAETTVDGWEDYDTVFIGYPIWWGIAAWPVDNFITANDFTGKTVIPFCSSASSGLGQSGEVLKEMAGTGNWQEGRRFSERASQSDITAWVNGLDLPKADTQPAEQETVSWVNGSPHKEGCTYTALLEVSSALNDNGVDTDVFWIGNKPLSGCIACKTCVKKHTCVFDDAVNEFLELAGDYDGFIFGTPVHWGGATGAMTSFLDRAFYADFCGGGNRFLLKPAGLAISARRAGTTAAWDQMNKYFGLMQMPIITSRYWNMVHGATPEEVRKDAEGMQIMRILGKNMAWFLKCKEAGVKAGISLPEQETIHFTNFIRE